MHPNSALGPGRIADILEDTFAPNHSTHAVKLPCSVGSMTGQSNPWMHRYRDGLVGPRHLVAHQEHLARQDQVSPRIICFLVFADVQNDFFYEFSLGNWLLMAIEPQVDPGPVQRECRHRHPLHTDAQNPQVRHSSPSLSFPPYGLTFKILDREKLLSNLSPQFTVVFPNHFSFIFFSLDFFPVSPFLNPIPTPC